MKPAKKCIICNSNLTKDPIESPAHCFDKVYQKCSKCGSFGYWKDELEAICQLSLTRKQELLSEARKKVDRHTTPTIELNSGT